MGLYFIQKYRIGLRWSDVDKGLLTWGKKVIIETINVYDKGPYILICSSLNLPPRTLAVLNAWTELKGKQSNCMKLNMTVYFQMK